MRREPLSPQQAFWAAVRCDFRVFVEQSFGTVYPGKTFEHNWHIDAMINALEDNFRGRKRRLIINLPPRHLKSFLVSVAWPAFLLGKDPSLKIFVVSYSEELAKPIARDFKRIVQSEWYRALFVHVRLTKVTETEVVTDQGGFRLALSVHGSITGRGADLIIVDDPCRPAEAASDKARTAINDWFRSTLLSRQDDKRTSGFILVMQRLHVNDLTGLLQGGGDYHMLSFPAIAEKDEVIELRNGQTYLRRRGEALHPQREDVAMLESMRDEIGSFLFESQYQQSPRTPEGTLFKLKNFKIIKAVPQWRGPGAFYISIDSALSTSSTSDFTAITTAYCAQRKLCVLDSARGRWEYEFLKANVMRQIQAYARPHSQTTVVIELAGSGYSLAQYLRALNDPRIRLLPFVPKGDKFVRASRVLPWFEPGIHLLAQPGKSDWVVPFLNEFMTFPNGANDDQVDSLVQLIYQNELRNKLDYGEGFTDSSPSEYAF